MSDAGKLHLCIIWDGKTVLRAEVKSTRPQAYRLLTGKSPEAVVQLLPLLFSVCGKAQQAAAMAAVSVAQGHAIPQIAMLERRVACEAMQEHLWKLLLDWPKLLGLPQQQEQFVHWHGALNAIASGRGDAEDLLAELYRILLGATATEWKHPDSYSKLVEWLNTKQGLLAPIISALELKESGLNFAGEQEACSFLPAWTASDLWQIYTGRFDPEFAVLPQHDGKPMETGALAHNQHKLLLQDVLRQQPARLLARLIARLIDLLDSATALAHGNIAGHVQGISAGEGAGLSVVQTARGMLLHHVRIKTGRIEEYLIVAPTEWNFHPQGALTGLIGLQESDKARLMETVELFVLSLDPCVEYEIEVSHA